MNKKEVSIRIIMILFWIISALLSIYITIFKNNLQSSGDFILSLVLLIFISALSCVTSLYYMKYISPLNRALNELNEMKN